MAARLRNLVILSRDAAKTVEFFSRGLQLPVVFSSPTMTELDAGSGIPLIVRSAASEAEVSSGYSPFVSFDVHDMDTLVPSLLGLGAVLDGPVQYDTLGKVAALRSPDGLMIALREPTTTTTTTTI